MFEIQAFAGMGEAMSDGSITPSATVGRPSPRGEGEARALQQVSRESEVVLSWANASGRGCCIDETSLVRGDQ